MKNILLIRYNENSVNYTNIEDELLAAAEKYGIERLKVSKIGGNEILKVLIFTKNKQNYRLQKCLKMHFLKIIKINF